MIELSITHFFVMVVALPFFFCGLAGFWRRAKERRARVFSRREAMRCRYCGTPFLRSGAPRVENCPRCRAANHAGRDRHLG